MPDGPLPDPETPVPVRFLPEYDNIFLSHQDRSRIADPRNKGGPYLKGFVLVDGFIRAMWKVTGVGAAATMLVRPVETIGHSDRAEVGHEAERLLRFLHPEATAGRVTIE